MIIYKNYEMMFLTNTNTNYSHIEEDIDDLIKVLETEESSNICR